MTRTQTLAPLLATALGTAFSVLTGCGTPAPTTGYTPITGIQIRASDVVAGHGCGTNAVQVYKYAAVVSNATDAGSAGISLASGVFDCFADGIFSNLPTCSGQTFDVTIYAYNRDSLPSAFDGLPNALTCPNTDASSGSVQAVDGGDGAGTANTGTTPLWQGSSNWTTTCTAIQTAGITTVASCAILEPSNAGSTSSDAAASE